MRPGSSSQPSQCASSRPVQTVGSRAQIRSTSSTASRELMLLDLREEAQHELVELVAGAPCSERAPSPRSSRGAYSGFRPRACRRSACISGRSSSPTTISVGTAISPSRSAWSGASSSNVGSPVYRLVELERPALHLADPAAQVRVDVSGERPWAVDPHPEIHLDRRVQVSTLERRFLFGPAGLGLLGPLVAGQAGVRRARAPRRAPDGRRRPRARPRRPARRRRARPGRAPGARAGRPGRARARTSRWRDGRLAEAAHVVADRPMQRRKGRPLGLPHPAVGDALVDEDDRGPFARDLVVQLEPASSRSRRR